MANKRTVVKSDTDISQEVAERENKDKQLRYWKFLLYPDSCGGGWESDTDYEELLDRLESLQVQMCLSPVHNRDVNSEGEFKKSHIHGIVYVPGKKSYKRMVELLSPFGVKYVLGCDDHEAAERYLLHLDVRNKVAKPEYPVEDLVCLNGYQCTSVYDRKVNKDMRDLHDYVEDNGVMYFCDLANWVLDSRPELLKTLDRFTAFWDRYLMSRERLVKQVRTANAEKLANNGDGSSSEITITSLMSSYKTYRIKFGR